MMMMMKTVAAAGTTTMIFIYLFKISHNSKKEQVVRLDIIVA